MLLLIVGLLIFFLIHLLPMQVKIRSGFIARFGETPYKAVFSLISAVGLVLIVLGYAKLQGAPGKNPELWSPPVWTRHITLLLMILAMILLAASNIPSRIRAATKHPMLAAIKLWALAHLLANGDLASVLLFGSFLIFAVVDRISLKQRHPPSPSGDRPKKPETPEIPRFQGTITGDILAIAAGLILYVALVFGLHELLFGVPPVASLAL